MKNDNKSKIVKNLLKQDISEKELKEILKMLKQKPISYNIDKTEEQNMTFGDKLADKLTEIAGSWTFIICFSLFLISWAILNCFILPNPIDPFPFILLNLLLSCIAALQAPIIMMSQNRQAKKDRLCNKFDYNTDLKSELILESIYKTMEEILLNQKRILKNNKNNK